VVNLSEIIILDFISEHEIVSAYYFFYHCFIAFIILPMYYGRFLSEIKLD